MTDFPTHVDLYSGQVRLALPLASLPGGNGPDVEIGLRYDGQVSRTLEHWNLSAPTGWLGLGWSLSFDAIAAARHGTADELHTVYYFLLDGVPQRLIQTGPAQDGLIPYALPDYRFWKILRHSDGRSWRVINEDGVSFVFGGEASGAIEWEVAWGNWLGESRVLTGQCRLPRRWNLAALSDPWGNTVNFQYEAELVPVGGPEGQRFTRAVYLSAITTQAGACARFLRAPKQPQEFIDPHGFAPAPNAWQDRFESDYLSSIRIYTPAQALLSTIDFDYGSPVEFLGEGPLRKRLLMGYDTRYDAGGTLPGHRFDYHRGLPEPGYGALASLTTPEGGSWRYSYRDPAGGANEIAYSARDLALVPPEANLTQPRLVLDDEFAAATWLKPASAGGAPELVIGAWTWTGQWCPQTPLARLALSGAAAYDGVQLACHRSLFAVYADKRLWPCKRDPRLAGRWSLPEAPFALELDDGEAVALTAGEDFVAVLGLRSGKLHLISWDGRQWQKRGDLPALPGAGPDFVGSLASRDRYLLVATTAGSNPGARIALRLLYLTPLSELLNVAYSLERPRPLISALGLTARESFAVLRVSAPFGAASLTSYHAVSWPVDFSKLETQLLTTQQSGRFGVESQLVGIGQELFRFDGSQWRRFDAASVSYSPRDSVVSLSYGADRLLRVLSKADGTQVADLIEYDPNQSDPAKAWRVPAELQGLPAARGIARAAQTRDGASRYVVMPAPVGRGVANCVYAKGCDGVWRPVCELPDGAEPDSVAILEEQYCLLQQNGQTLVQLLENGAATNTGFIPAPGRFLHAGRALVSASALMTYSGDWPSPSLTLYRAVRHSIKGSQSLAPVDLVEIASGYDTVKIAVTCEKTASTIAPEGYDAGYNQASWGLAPQGANQAPNGLSTAYFFNNLAPGQAPARPYPVEAGFNNADRYLQLLAGIAYAGEQRALPADGQSALTGALVAHSQSFIEVSEQALSELPGHRQLGFYQRPRRSLQTTDGVTARSETVYQAQSGLPQRVSSWAYNAAGALEEYRQDSTYWWQQYDPSRSRNFLSPVIATEASTVGPQGQSRTAATVTSWHNQWGAAPGRWASYQSYVATRADYQSFNRWTSEQPPLAEGWQAVSRVLDRSAEGTPLFLRDLLDRASLSLFDRSRSLRLAEFFNASPDEAGYYGCEPYEINKWWVYQSQDQTFPLESLISADQAHTGRHALRLPPSPRAGLCSNWLATAESRAYLFSCWVRTRLSGTPDDQPARWELQVWTEDGAREPVGEPVLLDFPAPDGKWHYLFQVIDLGQIRQKYPAIAGRKLGIHLRGCQKRQNLEAYVDELRFAPVDARFRAWVYHPSTHQLMAELGENGQTHRLVRDAHQRVIGRIGPDENVAELLAPSLSRLSSQNRDFDPLFPNSLLRAVGQHAGRYYDFDGSDTSDWVLPRGWSLQKWRLAYAGAPAPTPFSSAELRSFRAQNFAARVWVSCHPGANPAIGAGELRIYWHQPSSEYRLVRLDAPGRVIGQDLAVKAPLGPDWLLVVLDKLVMFFVNGVQILSYSYRHLVFYLDFSPAYAASLNQGRVPDALRPVFARNQAPLLSDDKLDVLTQTRDAVWLVAGNYQNRNAQPSYRLEKHGEQLYAYRAEVATGGSFHLALTGEGLFQELVICEEPQLSMAFSDGLGREFQRLDFNDAGGVIATGTIFDSAGRPAYRKNPVQTAPDLQFNRLSGMITAYLPSGKETLEDYLNPETYLPEQAYPYTQQLFEASPLSRVIASGQPGTPYSVDTVRGGHPSRFAYAGSAPDDPLTPLLPPQSPGRTTPGAYYVQRSETPFKAGENRLSYRLTNAAGQLIAERTRLAGEGAQTVYVTQLYHHDPAGRVIRTQLPQAFQVPPPPGSVAADWQIEQAYDFLGRPIRHSAPDTGTTRSAYDRAGRLRFRLDAAGSGNPPRIVYTKYDALDRPLETGTVQAEGLGWEAAVARADEPAWPPVTLPGVQVSQKWVYDRSTPPQPHLIGRLAQVETYTGSGQVTREAYRYSRAGEVLGSETQAGLYSDQVYASSYRYDNQGRLVELHYPYPRDAQGEAFAVNYSYDRLGRLSGVGRQTAHDDTTLSGTIPIKVLTTNQEKGKPWIKDIQQELLARIGEARQYIYFENFNFCDLTLTQALSRRLADPQCPDLRVIIVVPHPYAQDSYQEQIALGLTRAAVAMLAIPQAEMLRLKTGEILTRLSHEWEVECPDKLPRALLCYKPKGGSETRRVSVYDVEHAQAPRVMLCAPVRRLDPQTYLDDPSQARFHLHRVSMTNYRRVYVHSKLALFDDTHAVIGSANFNQRSMESDGELSVCLKDAATVRAIRNELFGHYNLPPMENVAKEWAAGVAAFADSSGPGMGLINLRLWTLYDNWLQALVPYVSPSIIYF